MILSLIPHDPPRRDLNSSYALRSRFWFTSVCAHILWVAVVVHIPLSSPSSKRPIYDQFIRPLESKVLIYRPPKKTAQASPETRVGKTPEPRGKIASPRTVIATAPNAKSQKQIISTPLNLPETKVDVQAPTVVARVETALPPPPKLAPKRFTPPPARKQDPKLPSDEITATLAPAPQLSAAQNNPMAPNTALPQRPKIAPRTFTPPPPSTRQPRLPVRTEVEETLVADSTAVAVTQGGPARGNSSLPPPPKNQPKQFKAPAASSGNARPAASSEVTETLSTLATSTTGQTNAAAPTVALSRIPGPPRNLPQAPEAARGNEKANIAIASVNPSPATTVPVSPRSGEFSLAPATGDPSSGAAAPGALTVPNLTVREPAPPKASAAKSNTVVYAEKVRASTATTFAIPLRPANRSIPRAVDARFPGRSVYAVVIPIENLPAYGGDWILWFAEAAPQPGQTPSLRAPVPYRKIELQESGREPKDTRIQLSATLGVDGKLTAVTVLSPVSPAVQALALEDLTAWEWKAATLNGVPIAIDAVFEIPFRLALRP